MEWRFMENAIAIKNARSKDRLGYLCGKQFYRGKFMNSRLTSPILQTVRSLNPRFRPRAMTAWIKTSRISSPGRSRKLMAQSGFCQNSHANFNTVTMAVMQPWQFKVTFGTRRQSETSSSSKRHPRQLSEDIPKSHHVVLTTIFHMPQCHSNLDVKSMFKIAISACKRPNPQPPNSYFVSPIENATKSSSRLDTNTISKSFPFPFRRLK
jgi:hypothetical protein